VIGTTGGQAHPLLPNFSKVLPRGVTKVKGIGMGLYPKGTQDKSNPPLWPGEELEEAERGGGKESIVRTGVVKGCCDDGITETRVREDLVKRENKNVRYNDQGLTKGDKRVGGEKRFCLWRPLVKKPINGGATEN